MAYILSIETATNVCSVALSFKNQLIELLQSQAENNHAAFLTIYIQEILKKANLTVENLAAVAVSKGAGSYTGLRVGFSVAKGLCYAADKPMILVDTLQALSWAMQQADNQPNNLYFPCIDARRMDAYAALYDTNNQQVMPLDCYTLTTNFFANFTNQKIIIGGNAAEKFSQILDMKNPQIVISQVRENTASYLCNLAYQMFENQQFVSVAYCEPVYLKPPFATIARSVF
jgi:tRNA threonylcarbamoyladenosine biosynthesis protein TsaB